MHIWFVLQVQGGPKNKLIIAKLSTDKQVLFQSPDKHHQMTKGCLAINWY